MGHEFQLIGFPAIVWGAIGNANPRNDKTQRIAGFCWCTMCGDSEPSDPEGNRTTCGNTGENELESILGSTCGSILSHPDTVQLLSVWADL